MTLFGTADDGQATSPIPGAICRFVSLLGAATPEVTADASGVFSVAVETDVEGFVECSPPKQRSLVLRNFVSTKGQAPGTTLAAGKVDPASTVFATFIQDTLAADPTTDPATLEAQLEAELARGAADMVALVQAVTLLFNAALEAGIDADLEAAIDDIFDDGELNNSTGNAGAFAEIADEVNQAIQDIEQDLGEEIDDAVDDVTDIINCPAELAERPAQIMTIAYKEQAPVGRRTHILASRTCEDAAQPLTVATPPTVTDLTGLVEVTFSANIPDDDADGNDVPDFLEDRNVILSITEVETGRSVAYTGDNAGDFFAAKVAGNVLSLRIKPQTQTARDLAPGLTYSVSLNVGTGLLDDSGQELSDTLNDVTVQFKTARNATCSQSGCQQAEGARIARIEYINNPGATGQTTVTLAKRQRDGALVAVSPAPSINDLTGSIVVIFSKAMPSTNMDNDAYVDFVESEVVTMQITEVGGVTIASMGFNVDDFFSSAPLSTDGTLLTLRIKPQNQTSKDLAPGKTYIVVLDVDTGMTDANGNELSPTNNDVMVTFTTTSNATCSQPGCQQTQ